MKKLVLPSSLESCLTHHWHIEVCLIAVVFQVAPHYFYICLIFLYLPHLLKSPLPIMEHTCKSPQENYRTGFIINLKNSTFGHFVFKIRLKLNLFQLPDIIRLIPVVTRHPKLLFSSRAYHIDCLTISSFFFSSIFLSLIPSTWSEDILSYMRTKQLWSPSIFGLLIDLLPFSYGAGLVKRCSAVLNLITLSPSKPVHCF